MPACKAPLFFLPSPTAYALLGRGQGVGQKPEPVSRRRRCPRLTFSSLDDVRQHLASPWKGRGGLSR